MPCKCGSNSHERINARACPLNPKKLKSMDERFKKLVEDAEKIGIQILTVYEDPFCNAWVKNGNIDDDLTNLITYLQRKPDLPPLTEYEVNAIINFDWYYYKVKWERALMIAEFKRDTRAVIDDDPMFIKWGHNGFCKSKLQMMYSYFERKSNMTNEESMFIERVLELRFPLRHDHCPCGNLASDSCTENHKRCKNHCWLTTCKRHGKRNDIFVIQCDNAL